MHDLKHAVGGCPSCCGLWIHIHHIQERNLHSAPTHKSRRQRQQSSAQRVGWGHATYGKCSWMPSAEPDHEGADTRRFFRIQHVCRLRLMDGWHTYVSCCVNVAVVAAQRARTLPTNP